ncbi:MAG: polyribonucleotide nucleotidyltransferase [Candidatus Pacebacteria bacterium]|nr:polyribonucleotide nucleotidyltransferase [Candidatus Paceibacterota bacterium]
MKFNLEINNKNLEVEYNNLAEQANGNVMVSLGDTVVLATSVMSKEERENLGFFPLTVEYEEKYYAAGKIKGSRYIKRESRPSDEAICNARLIDRAIRPLFDKDLSREVQVIATVLSWDNENDPDVLALISSSLSLAISDIPWQGPVSAARVIKTKDGRFILNPSYEERENSELDIVFAAVLRDKEILINMIEGGADEADEESVLKAFDLSRDYLEKLIEFQKEVAEKIGKEKIKIEKYEPEESFRNKMREILADRLEKALFQKDKDKRAQDVNLLKQEFISTLLESETDSNKIKFAKKFFDEEIDNLVHLNAIKHNKRVDGRKLDELREISCEVGLLKRAHGSALFSRGQTKSLSILTLGAPGDQQLLEGMEIVGKKRFMHHYNFPPYSTGEVKPVRGPGRREIGHGMLAEKAILPLIPSVDEFPYTIRSVSEMLSSNGSTSMASVTSTSLALMDAGVPIKNPASGIAIGLMQDLETEEFKVLTDIQGPEDHHGDMDFKVAGTEKGITAIQLDVKIWGINKEIMKEALSRAKKARLEILNKMKKVISGPRSELSPFAPRILTMQINPEKIREVIGPGGKIINAIIAETGVSIDIQDSGLIFITSDKEETANKALEWIKNITKEVEVGEVFTGKVKRILEFGAFVEILPGQEGMIHISKLGQKTRVKKVEDVLKIGDNVSVKVISIDEQGRINLTLLKKENK